jgi:diphthamide biosynthesis methyltransferase
MKHPYAHTRARTLLALTLITLSTACVSLNKEAESVRESVDRDIAQCQHVGTPMGSSTHHWITTSAAETNSRNEVLNKAAALGATHVVWGQQVASPRYQAISAQAYKCPLK